MSAVWILLGVVLLLIQSYKIYQKIAVIEAQIQDKNQQAWQLQSQITHLISEQTQGQHDQEKWLHQYQITHLKLVQDSIQQAMQDIRQQITLTLNQNATTVDKQMNQLNNTVNHQLAQISGQVEKRLMDGFEKTTHIFNDVVKRLAIIDSAQQKITELSSNVVDLQSVLMDKRARGAFGEVQLQQLVHNILPEQHFSLQHTLSNGKRVDCMLFLPEPTGHIAVDAKFPLEAYQSMHDGQLSEQERKSAQQQFRTDIRYHIDSIAHKYIISGETAEGAIMFIPAEAVFAEIHAHHPLLVEKAQQSRVWMASPTTLMAILTTAMAVLKDVATRKQVHLIQQHLICLNKDFMRFQQRMNNLARHIQQAHDDVGLVQTSSQKITARFEKIEQVELEARTHE